jgi:hypothetical protein
MSVTPDFVRGLDELVRTDLQELRDSYFYWLLVSTGVVILGVLLEGPELVWEVREVFRERRFPKNTELLTPISEHHTPAWIISISLAGWLLVSLGVAGEGIFEGYVSAADGLLQTFNNALLSDTSDRASTAEITAKAFESQIADANARAAVAAQTAEGEKLARVKLEKQIQPRTINQADREKLGGELRKFASTLRGRKVKMASDIGDAEGMLFSLEISDILTRAGIDVEDAGLGRVQAIGGVDMGAKITGPLADKEFIRSLAQGLATHANTGIKGEWKATYPEIRILVGVKPIAGLPID